jgi:hypothetical protein
LYASKFEALPSWIKEHLWKVSDRSQISVIIDAYFPIVLSAISVTTILQSEATNILDKAKFSASASASRQARASNVAGSGMLENTNAEAPR